MEDNLIKVLLKSECPHCLGEIYIEVESPAPIVKAVLRMVDIVSAKEYVVANLKESLKAKRMSQEDYDTAKAWIDNKDTVFGPMDVEPIIASIIKK